MSYDARMEQAIDRTVQSRLATDRAYRHAESAEAQTAREEEITRQVERELGAQEDRFFEQRARRDEIMFGDAGEEMVQ